MALAEDFQRVVDSLPPDWTQVELDLRLLDEDRYIDAATMLTQINAMPYSENEWHFRLRAANRWGHAAAHQAVAGTLALLDDQGIEGRLVAREARSGRVPVRQLWGRPESVRQELRLRGAVTVVHTFIGDEIRISPDRLAVLAPPAAQRPPPRHPGPTPAPPCLPACGRSGGRRRRG